MRMQHTHRLTSNIQTMYKRGWNVVNPLPSLLFAGSSSHCENQWHHVSFTPANTWNMPWTNTVIGINAPTDKTYTLRPQQNGRHFADAILECISFMESFSFHISMELVSEGHIYMTNMSSWVQDIMSIFTKSQVARQFPFVDQVLWR